MKILAVVQHGDRIHPRYSVDQVVQDGTIAKGSNAGQPRYRYLCQEAFYFSSEAEARSKFQPKESETLIDRCLQLSQIQ